MTLLSLYVRITIYVYTLPSAVVVGIAVVNGVGTYITGILAYMYQIQNV